VLLFITRIRGASLVTAGRVSRAEFDGFLLRVFVVFGLLFGCVGVFHALSSERDIFCLIVFPPKHIYGAALWCGQIVVSVGVVVWVWTRNGADLLPRLAPAFIRGSMLERRVSPAVVRLVVTSVAVLAPLSNILIQLNQPIVRAGCSV